MEQLQVSFARYNQRQATAKQGPNAGNQFTIHEFFTADGTKFDTTKAEIANAAYGLSFDGNGNPTNQAVLITFEVSNNGQYTNRKLQAVQAVGAGGAMAPGVVPNVGGTPAAAVPAAAPVTNAAPAAATMTPTRTADHPDTAARIARSVGLELALKAVGNGIVHIEEKEDLFNIAHEFGAYVFNGSRPSAATGAVSSGAGGGDAGAAQAAPAVAEPAAEFVPAAATAEPNDDIPF